ncbi:MAG: hypothetical protein E7056_07465 [Lentisphaerae bacterium]|nr:hypothetical protein [Lentisphaerota bacterium]
MKKMCLIALMMSVVLVSTAVRAYDEAEWRIRPWEIIQGLKPHSELVWDVAKGDLSSWKVSGAAALSEYDKIKLWGDKVAKLDLPDKGSVTLTLAQPQKIEAADGLDVWIFGPLSSIPKIDFVIKDAKNMIYRVPTSGCGSRWAKQRWWGAAAGLIPEKVQFPIVLTGIRFSRLSNRVPNDFLCFDRIGAYKVPKVELVDSGKMKNSFPLTEDGIMPIGMREGAKNSVSKNGRSYIFRYDGKDAKIAYTYTPESGTLSDLSVTVNGKTFQPAVNGGIHAQVGKVKFTPSDSSINAKLLKKELKNNRLATTWQWSRHGVIYKFELNFRIKGKSLAVEVKSLSEGGTAFDCGKTAGTVNPRLFALTYLHNRWNYPRFMATDDYFMSVFLDWYSSNAAGLMEGSGRGGIDGARVYAGENSARLMGGSSYGKLTNGKYNPIYERMYITVSPELDDTMPHIANPASRFLKETSNLVCHTRMYPLQGQVAHVDQELAMWAKFHAYGVTDMFVRTHSGLQRTPVESNNIAFQIEGAHQNGGTPAARKLSDGMRKYVKRFGFYSDTRVVSPLSEEPFFNYGILTKYNDNTYIPGWDGIFRPKTGVLLALQKHHVTELLKRFPSLNGQYLDELSNAPPWADTDFDADVPGAGKFATVLRDYGLVALQQKELFNGPIWSEGCAAFYWAGLLDVDYAVSNDTKAGLPLIVDFKLKRLNQKSNFTGSDWPIVGQTNIDYLLANEIACGNIGHLGQSGEGAQPRQGLAVRFKNYEPVLKSYFMIRQVQEYYGGQIADRIEYEINGKMMTASEMLKGNHQPSGRIHAVYPTGLQTWVNHNKEGNWTVNVEGEEYVLPPYGHVAIVPDELLQYTAIKNGHVVDYSNGKHFVYLNGRGETTEFPEMTAAYAYVIRQIDGKTRITPAPFKKAETIKGLSYTKATPLKQDGQAQGATVGLDVTDAGMGDLPIDGKAFHYTME